MFKLLFAFCAALFILQWREGGLNDLSWLLWFIVVQSIVHFVSAFSLWRTSRIRGSIQSAVRRAIGLAAVCNLWLLVSYLPAREIPVLHFLTIEISLLVHLVAMLSVGYLLSKVKIGAQMGLLGTAAFGVALLHAASFALYLSPLPPGIEVLSWTSGIGRSSSSLVELGRFEFSRLNFFFTVQAFLVVVTWIFSSFAVFRAKGFEQAIS
jgi:hypothetical protein